MPSKKVLTALGILIIIVLVLIAIFALPLITESPPAVLVVESGVVEVAQSPLRAVTGEVQMKQGDTIKTGADGKASVVLFGSSVIRLESNTEINLKELAKEKGSRRVSINQSSGRVWSRVVKLSGVDNYEVRTPRSVATIRGTGFDSWIRPDSTVETSVVDGTVAVRKIEEESSVDVTKDFAVTADTAALSLHAIVRDDWISRNEQRDTEWALQLRNRIKQKYWVYIEIAKAQYKLTDEDVNRFIDDAIAGKYTQEELNAALERLGVELKL